ncbi:hypothetical protein DIPPA_14406 [Diplonema papillatum]|nr:hypothetical protein DIPPA_14406 [Diplonema papillatum]
MGESAQCGMVPSVALLPPALPTTMYGDRGARFGGVRGASCGVTDCSDLLFLISRCFCTARAMENAIPTL